MTVSTIRQKSSNFSTIIVYLLGVIGIGLVVFFGGQAIQNWDSIKKKSMLRAESYYMDAEIFVNNEKVGDKSVDSKEVKPGENKITIKNADRFYETKIDFLSNNTSFVPTVAVFRDLGVSDLFSGGQEFWFEKDKSGSLLRIISEPADAKVYIDNAELGNTPYSSNTLSEGGYDLRMEIPGYETYSTRVNIIKGYTLNISVKFFPIPVPNKVSAIKDLPDLYNVSLENDAIVNDPQTWVKAVVYWNKTRGINLEGSGVNKEEVFDYFVDYKGNVYDRAGNLLKTTEELKTLTEAERGAYLGKVSDGETITPEAKDALETMNKSAGKQVKIKATPTGWLRVRDAANLNGAELTRVNVGDTYTVLEENQGWSKIKVSETVSGWVSSDYVEEVKIEVSS